MVREITSVGYSAPLVKRVGANMIVSPWLPYLPKGTSFLNRGWCSGATAAHIACKYIPNITDILLLGFDIGDKTNRPNNIYKGTGANYPITQAQPYHIWASQFLTLFVEYPNITFSFVGEYSIEERFKEGHKYALTDEREHLRKRKKGIPPMIKDFGEATKNVLIISNMEDAHA